MTAPSKAAMLASGLADAMAHLADVLERENEALLAGRPRAIAGLLREKNAAARSYEAKITALRDETADFRDLDGAKRNELAGLAAALAPLAEDNARLLKVAIEVNHRLLDAVADAVKAVSPAANAYSRSGSPGNGGAAAPAGVALTVNRSL